MSSHAHVVATDPRGVYPDFLRDFHGLLARLVNALRGRWEHFWDASQASAVVLEDDAAQLDKLTYTLTNPVGLVHKAADWPGATSIHAVTTGRPIVAVRPKHFFRDDDSGGSIPATVALHFEPLPGWAHLSPLDYSRTLQEQVAAAEQHEAVRRRDGGAAVLGPRKVLAQRWSGRQISHDDA